MSKVSAPGKTSKPVDPLSSKLASQWGAFQGRTCLSLDCRAAELAAIQGACEAEKSLLVDAHVHLGFTNDALAVAKQANELGVGAFNCTVEPREFIALSGQLTPSAAPNIVLGAGFHPWWVARATPEELERDLGLLLGCLQKAPAVGEVGLDFAPRFVESASAQRRVLRAIMREAASLGGKPVSIHCVRAYDDLFAIMESTGVLDSCQVILHWFSGDGDDLQRALRLGCFFSVGTRMLATKRGRAYASQIPAQRLLLETDGPAVDPLAPDFEPAPFDVVQWRNDLLGAKELLRAATNR